MAAAVAVAGAGHAAAAGAAAGTEHAAGAGAGGPRPRLAPILAVAAAAALGAGDVVWWLTRHRVAGKCSAVMAHSRGAPYLAVASVVLAFASLVTVVLVWSSDWAGARRGRWTSIILSSLVMIGAALSLLAMSVDATFEICF